MRSEQTEHPRRGWRWCRLGAIVPVSAHRAGRVFGDQGSRTWERAVPVFIDTVAWVCLKDGRILCARPSGKDIFYIPGGKREGAEDDLQALVREIAEELTVALLPETITHVGTYEAHQSHGLTDGAVVRMSCYAGSYFGTLGASSEIAELAWFCYADRPRVPPVDQLLFDDLKAAGQLR
jgi:8-oxo-dGTP diphosphatase